MFERGPPSAWAELNTLIMVAVPFVYLLGRWFWSCTSVSLMTCNTTLGAVLDWPSFSTFSNFCSADMWISGINIFKTFFHIIHPSYSWQVLIVLVIFCLFVLSTIMWYGVSQVLPEAEWHALKFSWSLKANIACQSLPFRSMWISIPRVLNISSLRIFFGSFIQRFEFTRNFLCPNSSSKLDHNPQCLPSPAGTIM